MGFVRSYASANAGVSDLNAGFNFRCFRTGPLACGRNDVVERNAKLSVVLADARTTDERGRAHDVVLPWEQATFL